MRRSNNKTKARRAKPNTACLPSPSPNRLIHTARQRHGAEPQVPARPVQELERPQRERLLAEDVLPLLQLPLVERALAAAVELPERAVGGLDEADVVQVDVVGGLGGGRVALAGGGVVRLRERAGRLEEAGALVRREGDGLLEELV